MNILVTGGCGFIGSHIAEHHLKNGDNVHIVDNLSSGSLKNIAHFQKNYKFSLTNADILHWPELKSSVKWADRIYHMAAIIGVYRVLAEPLNVFSTNILGCERLLNTIYKNNSRPQVIIASSSSVYGHTENPLLDEKCDITIESTTHPLFGYVLSKIVNENLGLAYYHAAEIPVISVRLFNVIGPRQIGRYGMVVPRFIQQACRNIPITVYGDGLQTRSFCDVRDVVVALELLAANKKSTGEIINIGQDSEISIISLAQLIQKRANSNSEIEYIPYSDAYDMDFIDIHQRRPNLTKFYELSGFKHQWTLEKSIDDLIALYRNKVKK